MADNNKVTIDAAWFAELYARANDGERIRKYCFECNIEKERDELKAKLEESQKHYCTNATGKLGDACKVAALCRENEDRLAAAERCIEDVWNVTDFPRQTTDVENARNIIRAYREAKEAGR